MKTYQPIYSVDGKLLSKSHPWFDLIQRWGDSCWNYCIPDSCSGLSYLDVGCSDGLYLLRFFQSGGKSFGLDSGGPRVVESNCKGLPLGGTFRVVKEGYQANYVGLSGGYNESGDLINCPGDEFDYTSCMNVLEYLVAPRRCLDSLLSVTRKKLLFSSDIWFEQESRWVETPNKKGQWMFSLVKVLGWFPFAGTYWIHDTFSRQFPRFQVFVCWDVESTGKLKPGFPMNFPLPPNEFYTQKRCRS